MSTAQEDAESRALAGREREARDAILPDGVRIRAKEVGDDVHNVAFGDTLLWLARQMELGQAVTPEWLRDEATATYQMVASDAE